MQTPITKESLEAIGFVEDLDTKKLFAELAKTDDKYIWESYESPDHRFIVRKGPTNISYDNGWSIHIDNSDMCTIANCDVEYIEQIQTLMELYKTY